jgi:hypothetical protein
MRYLLASVYHAALADAGIFPTLVRHCLGCWLSQPPAKVNHMFKAKADIHDDAHGDANARAAPAMSLQGELQVCAVATESLQQPLLPGTAT